MLTSRNPPSRFWVSLGRDGFEPDFCGLGSGRVLKMRARVGSGLTMRAAGRVGPGHLRAFLSSLLFSKLFFCVISGFLV